MSQLTGLCDTREETLRSYIFATAVVSRKGLNEEKTSLIYKTFNAIFVSKEKLAWRVNIIILLENKWHGIITLITATIIPKIEN